MEENIFDKLSVKMKEVTDSGNALSEKLKQQRIDFQRFNEELIDNCNNLTKNIKNELD